MNTESGYELSISVAENNKTVYKVWSLTDTKALVSKLWLKGQIKLQTTGNYRIYIESILGTDQKDFFGTLICNK